MFGSQAGTGTSAIREPMMSASASGNVTLPITAAVDSFLTRTAARWPPPSDEQNAGD